MEKVTKVIKCRNCGKEFEFTGGEQTFYESKGFEIPVRCSECRAARKAQTQEVVKTQEEKTNEFEAMLDKFMKNTVSFDDEGK